MEISPLSPLLKFGSGPAEYLISKNFDCCLTAVWRGQTIKISSVFKLSNHYCAIRHLEIYKMKLYNL